jgi:hypothetical protein
MNDKAKSVVTVVEPRGRKILLTDNGDGTCIASEANRRRSSWRGIDFKFNGASLDEVSQDIKILTWIGDHFYEITCSPQGRRRLKSKKRSH